MPETARERRFDMGGIAKKLKHWTGYAQTVTWLYTLLGTAVLPLFFDASRYIRLTHAKFGFYVWITLGCLALLLLRYIADGVAGLVRLPAPKQVWRNSSLTQKLLVLFCLIACISAACSPYPEIVWMGGARYNGLFLTLLYGAGFLMASCFGAADRTHIYALAVSAALVSALGVAMQLGADPLRLYPAGQNAETLQFLSTLGNVDFVNSYLSMLLPLMGMAYVVCGAKRRYVLIPPILAAFWLLLSMDVDAGKVAVAAWLVLFLPAFFQSGARLSRTGELAGLLSATLGGWLLTGKQAATPLPWILLGAGMLLMLSGAALPKLLHVAYPQKAFRIASYALVAVALLGAIFLPIRMAYLGAEGFLAEIGHVLCGDAPDYFGHGRVGIWRRAWELACMRPWIGFGPDAFMQAFAARFSDFIQETSGAGLYDAAHNEYLQYACLYGFTGAAVYVAFLGSLIVRAVRGARENGVVTLLLAGVVGYAVQAFFGLSVVLVAPVFFLLCGLLESELHAMKRTASGGKKNASRVEAQRTRWD